MAPIPGWTTVCPLQHSAALAAVGEVEAGQSRLIHFKPSHRVFDGCLSSSTPFALPGSFPPNPSLPPPLHQLYTSFFGLSACLTIFIILVLVRNLQDSCLVLLRMAGNGPRHTWTDGDRVILALLYRLYSNEKTTLLQIFNAINRHVLSAEGFPNGSIPVTTLMTQFYQMKKSRHPVWARVFNGPLKLVRRHYRVQKDKIEECAQDLKIQLELRVETHTTTLRPRRPIGQQEAESTPHSTSKVVDRDAWSPSTIAEDNEGPSQDLPSTQPRTSVIRQSIRAFAFDPDNKKTDEVIRGAPAASKPDTVSLGSSVQPVAYLPAVEVINDCSSPSPTLTSIQTRSIFQGVYVPTPTKMRTPSPETMLADVRSSPKLMSEFNSDGSHGKRHPVLLFRAFDPELGFTSRRFQGCKDISKPPVVNSDEFKAEVTQHLFVRRDYDSPFISLTQFARYGLRIISHSQKAKNFAVYLYSDLEEEGAKRNKMKPCLVPKICDRHDLNERLPNKYRGRGEFLVWGRIDSPPLLTLDTGEALELLGTLKSMESCTLEAAAELYQFLKDVDPDFREVVLRALVSSMKIPGYDSPYRSRAWLEFADVLFRNPDEEARSYRADSVLSTITIHRTPSSGGEAYLLIENNNAEEDNVDIRATEEYLHLVLSRPKEDENDGGDPFDEQQQAAVDAQLHSDVQAYGLAEDVTKGVASQQPDLSTVHEESIDVDDDTELVVMMNATITQQLTSSPRAKTPPSGRHVEAPNDSRSHHSSDIIDLTADTVMTDDDLIMLNEDDDDDCIIVDPAPHRLPIRPLSVLETPTRPSRYADQHVQVLD